MCNWKKWFWPGILATVLLTALALQMKSGTIEQDLQSKSMADLSANHNWASVELDGRDLTLSGQSPSEDAITEALQLADDAYDVRIANSVATLLPEANPFTLSAIKADNKLVLSGNVPSEEVRQSITESAKGVYQGAEIVDEMQLARGASDGFADLASFGIGQLKDLNSGSALLSGMDLSVTGEAPSVAIYDSVIAALGGTLPGNGKLASADITGPTADPFTLSAVKSETGIVLEGFVPSITVKEKVAAAAAGAANGKPVTDNLKLSLGAPDGFDELAGFGIAQLTDLVSGDAALSGSDLSVTGAAPTVGIYNSVNAALNGALPGNGNLVLADISSPIADPYTFSAVKSADGIVLDGFVPSNDVRAEMVAAAESANPGKPVTDNLRLALGNHDGFSALAGFGVNQLKDLTTGEASLSGKDLTVKGTAPTVAIYNAANESLNGPLPGEGKLAMADVSSPIADPYVLTASKTGNVLELNGFLPSEQARADVVVAAENANPGVEVKDNLRLALGNPDGFGALAGFSVAQLGSLSQGEASLNGLDLSIKGEAKTFADFDTVTANLANNLPTGSNLAMTDITKPDVSPYVFSAVEKESGVTLDGFVPNDDIRKTLVEAAAKTTSGNVTDNLQIGTGEPAGFADIANFGVSRLGDFSTGTVSLSDLDLSIRGTALSPDAYDAATNAASGAIPANGNVVLSEITRSTVTPYTFSAIKNADSVTLSGFVSSEAEQTSAVDFATKSNPGVSVVDQLVIANGVPNGVEWGNANSLAIKEVSALSAGSASITDNQYTIEGMAKTVADFDAVKAEANAPLSAGLKLAKEDVRLPIASPYIWKLSNIGEGAAELSGFMLNAEAIDKNAKQSMALLGGKSVANNLTRAGGAPDKLADAIAVGTKAVSRLKDGVAEISDSQLMVSGEAATDSEAADIRSNVEKLVPAGFTGKHNITVKKVVVPKPEPKPEPVVVQAPKPVAKPIDCQMLIGESVNKETILFETNKSVIKQESFPLLQRVIAAVQQCPTATIEVSGHTDSDGSEGYNQRLSEDRANAVRVYLVSNGIFAGRLKAVGFGEAKPVADNATDEGKAMNRRIDFTVVR